MKFLTLTAFALVSMVFQASAQVPVRPGDVKIDKIIPAVVKTPEYQITGGQNKRYKTGDWLEVEVEFTTAPELIDELTFSYKMLVNGKLLVGDACTDARGKVAGQKEQRFAKRALRRTKVE